MRLALLLPTAVLAGCAGGDDAPVSRGADAPVSREANGDCVRAWNAAGNAANQAAAARNDDGWSVEISEFHVSHPAWEADGDLRWGIPPTSGGERTPEQEIHPPNAILRTHGKLARLPADHGRPVGDREWKAVVDDWYDNGEFDHAHRGAAVREASRRLPLGRPSYSSVFDDLRRYAEQVC